MILIIDNYDSFTYNLVHLVGRYTSCLKVVRNDTLSVDDVQQMAPDGILISPGPGRPADAGICKQVIRSLGSTVPILGVCLGHQAIGEVFGGKITYAPQLMHGKTSDIFHDSQTVFQNIPNPFTATRYHSLVIESNTIPDSLQVSARTYDGVIMGVRHCVHPIEGIQFHPESVLSIEGPALVANWLTLLKKSGIDERAA